LNLCKQSDFSFRTRIPDDQRASLIPCFIASGRYCFSKLQLHSNLKLHITLRCLVPQHVVLSELLKFKVSSSKYGLQTIVRIPEFYIPTSIRYNSPIYYGHLGIIHKPFHSYRYVIYCHPLSHAVPSLDSTSNFSTFVSSPCSFGARPRVDSSQGQRY